jgi:hypothetical protein
MQLERRTSQVDLRAVDNCGHHCSGLAIAIAHLFLALASMDNHSSQPVNI